MTALRLIACTLILLAAGASAQARTMYVDDTLSITMRSGEGTQFRILKSDLTSGTRLDLVRASDSGYSLVRTPDGVEGWVLSRYLTDSPIARDRLVRANRELEDARKQLAELRQELAETKAERDTLASSESSLESRTQNLSSELAQIKEISANALSLDRRNSELQEENQRLRNDVEVLTAEKERLETKSESDFMLLGAGLVLLGIILALIIPLLKPSKKADNWA
ncbi:TIGR04211 family SH3 domain-containing protein [Marinobacter zhejiangensis]|uniref:SH3 domain protein n=1 Tax=Marinobacter zhejiangensis TaxID=488535 RepID=A0A1I4NVD5_9GAMM|nr:TIGR04211 family SH3 domain-containing protein [Marinobacter zhejiangensis]SFM19481.1 SH3 domain protein [Marinobacter zhejiangensis]